MINVTDPALVHLLLQSAPDHAVNRINDQRKQLTSFSMGIQLLFS